MRDNREDEIDMLRVMMDEHNVNTQRIPSARESICWHDAREELPTVGGLYIVARRRKKGSRWRFDLAQRGETGWTFGAIQGFAVQYWAVLTLPEEVEQDEEMAGADRADG